LRVLDVTVHQPVEMSVRHVGTWNGHATREVCLLDEKSRSMLRCTGKCNRQHRLTLTCCQGPRSRLFLSFRVFSNDRVCQEDAVLGFPLTPRSRPKSSGVRREGGLVPAFDKPEPTNAQVPPYPHQNRAPSSNRWRSLSLSLDLFFSLVPSIIWYL